MGVLDWRDSQSLLLLKQGELVCDAVGREEVVCQVYAVHFGYEPKRRLSLNRIRGMKGAHTQNYVARPASRRALDAEAP